jgi:hypothetical protein
MSPTAVSAQPAPSAKTETDTVDFSPTGTVEIDNRTGRITVSTWDRPQVGYAYTLAPGEDGAPVGATLDITRDDQEISFGHDHSWSLRIPGVLTISPDGTGEPVGDHRVVMPKRANLRIDDFGSAIEVSNLEGNAEIETHQGTVTIRRMVGRLNLDIFSGTAKVTGFRGRAELETYSGRITAAVEELSGATDVDTHSGPVRLSLPPDTGFDLTMDADSTNVTVDEAFGPPTRADDRLKYNGGGPEVSVESFSGTIKFRPLASQASSSP